VQGEIICLKKRVVQNFLTCWRIRHKRCSNCRIIARFSSNIFVFIVRELDHTSNLDGHFSTSDHRRWNATHWKSIWNLWGM